MCSVTEICLLHKTILSRCTVVTVTVDTPALTVPEDGSTVDVCVSLSRDAAVPVTVNFNTIETSATGESVC